jgi:hypothetical protein
MISKFKRLTMISMFVNACATGPALNDTSSTVIDPTATESFKLSKTAAKLTTGLADYKYKEKSYKAEWLRCTVKNEAPFVAVFHEESTGFEAKNFCASWQAQVLLNHQFNVVAVNRPSFGGSTGSPDFSGPQSLAAAGAAIVASGAQAKLSGIWGYDTGTITAAFLAKSQAGVSWIMLGNGFYDMEVVERYTKSDKVIAAITAVKTSEGDPALEHRSIAWDSAGLPKIVLMYHSKSDDIAPKIQADALNDQLRTAQTKVFFDVLDGIGHDIPWQAHYQIVERSLKNLDHK